MRRGGLVWGEELFFDSTKVEANASLDSAGSRALLEGRLEGHLAEAFDGEAPDCAVHHGGPVEPGRGFVLHSTDWGGQDSLQVNGPNGTVFAMTGTIDILKAIAEGKGPSQWIAALGYAGWGEGQLEEEMTRHGWFAADSREKLLFDTPTDERWAAAFKAEGESRSTGAATARFAASTPMMRR